MPDDLVRRIENGIRGSIQKLRRELNLLSLRSILDHYQVQLDFSHYKLEEFPDGFWAKWRYIWALRLTAPPDGSEARRDQFASIDKQIEDIFDAYGLGAVYDRGKDPRSEPEFMTRLGLALRVREISELSFPEQFRDRMVEKFTPFDELYFVPKFGVPTKEIFAWMDACIEDLQDCVNELTSELFDIMSEVEPYRIGFASGQIEFSELDSKGKEANWGARLNLNGERLQNSHVCTRVRIQKNLPQASLDALISFFEIVPSTTESTDVLYPHSDNPLREKFLVKLDNDHWYFADPSCMARVLSAAFEDALLADDRIRDKYLRNRDKTAENKIADILRRLDPAAEIHQNFFTSKGTYEKDIFFRAGRTVILVECKNSRIREFEGRLSDLTKFKDDFKRSVQYGFEQALGAKKFILANEEAIFLDSKGNPYFSVRRDGIDAIYIVCITENTRGMLGTDLSYFLEKENGEPYPLAMRLFDFQTICEHIGTAEKLIEYLDARQRLHGTVWTGDELNYAGYFLRYGNLAIAPRTMIQDCFSSYFDEKWYRSKGIEVGEKEYPEKPFMAEMQRKGNTITFRNKDTGELMDKTEIKPDSPAYIERLNFPMGAHDRNKPCPCGSGRKLKKCHGRP